MESEGSRVFRSSNRTKGDKNREGKSKRSFGVANAKRSQRHTEILRTGELLPLVY